MRDQGLARNVVFTRFDHDFDPRQGEVFSFSLYQLSWSVLLFRNFVEIDGPLCCRSRAETDDLTLDR
jgi:hypothetical protein